MYDYINEAFKKLSLLNEELFDTSLNGINQLSNFIKDDDADNTVDVIDPEAKTDEELSDSYIGKVIVNCNICHSHIFKPKEDIKIDEDGVVNSEDICPYCGEDGGFVIVGEICKFTKSDDFNKETDTPVEDDITNKEDISAETTDDKEVEESVDLSLIPGTVADVLLRHKDEINACGGDEQAVKKLITDILSGDEVKNSRDALDAIRKINSCSGGKLWSTIATYMTSQRVAAVGSEAKRRRLTASLAEDVNKVNVETDDSIICVKTDDDCKVTVSTELKEDEDKEESVEPVSDETIADIESQNDVESDEAEKDDESTEELTAKDVDENTDEFIDIDVEEVDEKSLDELGESYLKNVYENVESFKTTDIFTDTDNKHIVVEGLITFKSGAKKSTGFIFEAHSATESGKVKFVGKNDHFSKGNKSFILTGNVSNKTFLPESLTYNYRVKTADGKFSKLHGVVHTVV